MAKVLTISVAAYNVENFITQCLNSMVVPEVVDDLEVFVIDDGGTDQTIEIAEEYAAQYPNTFIPVHKDNGGYGTTVNYSISHATGKYFKILDGDDWFDRKGLAKLVNILQMSDADAVVTTGIYKGPDPACMKEIRLAGWNEEKQIKAKDIPTENSFNTWQLTFKTDLLRRCNLNLPAHMLYTDSYYFTVPFAQIRKVQYVDCFVYCYRTNREGQSTSRDSRIKHLQENIKVSVDLCRFCEQMISENNENSSYITQRVASIYRSVVRAMLLLPICKDSLAKLMRYETMIEKVCPSVHRKARKLPGKSSLLLRIFDITHYKAYWLLKLVPGGIPNFQ